MYSGMFDIWNNTMSSTPGYYILKNVYKVQFYMFKIIINV